MTHDWAARTRTGIAPDLRLAPQGGDSDLDPRVHVTLDHLRGLERRAKTLSFLPKQPARSALNGRHGSRIRGRGLDFEELRHYLPSDDVRSIDWKVTARTGTPHVRVFTEERDRPTLIVVDQRMSMFFGSVLNMKSVTAAECAALAAFRVLAQGDRIGGIVFGDTHIAEIRPKRTRAAITQFLTAITTANRLLDAQAPDVSPVPLNKVLRSVQRIASRDHLVIFISDFDGADDKTRDLLSGMSQRNDIILGLVSDPTAQHLDANAPLIATDGTKQAALDLSNHTTRARLVGFSQGRLQEVQNWQNQMRLSILPLTSASPTLGQMQRLMGQPR
jgi:uncharacterized protein (DUF58 family)